MKETSKRGNWLLKPAAARPLLLGLLILAVVVAIFVPLYVLRNTMLSQLAGIPTNVRTGLTLPPSRRDRSPNLCARSPLWRRTIG